MGRTAQDFNQLERRVPVAQIQIRHQDVKSTGNDSVLRAFEVHAEIDVRAELGQHDANSLADVRFVFRIQDPHASQAPLFIFSKARTHQGPDVRRPFRHGQP